LDGSPSIDHATLFFDKRIISVEYSVDLSYNYGYNYGARYCVADIDRNNDSCHRHSWCNRGSLLPPNINELLRKPVQKYIAGIAVGAIVGVLAVIALAIFIFRRGYKSEQRAKVSDDTVLKPELMGSVPGKGEKKKKGEEMIEMDENNSRPLGPGGLQGTPRSELP